jgi:hypothetical protein
VPEGGVFTTEPDSSNLNCPKASYAELTGHSERTTYKHDAMATDSELQKAVSMVPTPLYFNEVRTAD